MSINEIIIYVITFFMAIAVIDKVLGNKLGMGKEFEDGIMAMGSLAMAMVGIISLAPVLADLLYPVLGPIYGFFGADPAMFGGTILAPDMGGYTLANQFSNDPRIVQFSGIILAAMLGGTICFTIPVALGILEKEDYGFFAQGILAGFTTIPLGCFVSGLMLGLDVMTVVKNLMPPIIVALLIALGLKFFQSKMISGFLIFGKGISAMNLLGFGAIIVETLTGLVIIPGLAPISESIAIVGDIAIVLAGTYPLLYVIMKVFKKPLMKAGGKLGIGDVSVAGLIANIANNLPMLNMLKDMDDRGKIINVAFTVSAGFLLGDHLGFAAGVAPESITSMIVGKLISGFSAIVVAHFMTRQLMPQKNKVKESI